MGGGAATIAGVAPLAPSAPLGGAAGAAAKSGGMFKRCRPGVDRSNVPIPPDEASDPMVSFRRFVSMLALSILSWAGSESSGDEVRSLPPVEGARSSAAIVGPAPVPDATETTSVVPWVPDDALDDADGEAEGTYPSWSAVRVEALLLWRDAPQSVPLVDFAGGGTALDARDLHSGAAAGPRFTLLSEDSDGEGSQIAYFDVASFQATRRLPTVAGGYTTSAGLDGAAPAVVDGATAGLSSRIKSLEVLDRKRTGERWVGTSGFRWVEWQEVFGLGAGPQAFGVRAIDSLYGHQWGLEADLWRPMESVALEGVAKAGIYGNVSKQDSFLAAPGGGASIATSTARVGFVGEAGLVATWRVRPWLAARAGYQAFWLGGVATATNQLRGQSLVAGSPARGSTNTGGSVVLQGIDLGLEGRW